jgi:phosphoenolpyruvate phosphomutase
MGKVRLHSLLSQGRPLRFLEAHNGISALIVENTKARHDDKEVKFDGIWVSSFTDSASKGLPDAELTGAEARASLVEEIAQVTKLPIIVDGDTGGTFTQLQYLVKKLELAGADAVVIEDKVYPKLNSLDPDAPQRLEDPKNFSQKIRFGKTASSEAFSIFARLESFNVGTGIEDAVRRARSYIEAGADGILIHSRSTRPNEVIFFASQYERLCSEIGRRPPLICVPTTFNLITDEELGRAGFNIMIHANQMLRSSHKAMKAAAEIILLNDRGFEADASCSSVREIFEAVGFYEARADELTKVSKLTVIIPAAGRDPIFNETSKSLIPIAGKPILEHQLETLRSIGLRKFVLIRGYKGDQINRDDVVLIDNADYQRTHSLHSLFVAREHMNTAFLLVFSDILFNREILTRLLNSDADSVLVVDNAYRFHRRDIQKQLDLIVSRQKAYMPYRTLNPTRMIEIRTIGKKIPKELADHEFVGLAYFSENIAPLLPEIYDDCKQKNRGRFHEAESFERASITDFFQELIDRGFTLNGQETFKGWMEIHFPEDVKTAEMELSQTG